MDDDEARPETTTSSNEMIAEASGTLIRHLMADKVPEDEQTMLIGPRQGISTSRGSRQDHGRRGRRFQDTPFIGRCKNSGKFKTENQGSSTSMFSRASFKRRAVYQPSTTAEDPEPLRAGGATSRRARIRGDRGKEDVNGNDTSNGSINHRGVEGIMVGSQEPDLAISSTQDWTSAAIHRAVVHISARIPPDENDELRQQLDGVRHMLCFLGKVDRRRLSGGRDRRGTSNGSNAKKCLQASTRPVNSAEDDPSGSANYR